jgi:LDH2 family malate/lactate/ureidoglycolate dehydrogenase/aryl carrier-like protein
MVVPLSAGAAVIVAFDDQVRNQETLLDLICDQRVTVVDLVPTYLKSCLHVLAALDQDRHEDLLDNQLRLVLSASEPLPPSVVKEWILLDHPAELVNMYGQTETTGIVATHLISYSDADASRPIPIGRPIAGTRIYVLDEFMKLVPVGTLGELYIGGSNVGNGYLGLKELTESRFVPDPFTNESDARLYRTGDRARYRSDGVLELSGRLDSQIKVRGHRVEPAEIESVLAAHPHVSGAMVVPSTHGNNTQIAAYVVAKSGTDSSLLAADCRLFLQENLPNYMVPATITVLDALPRTVNGKLNRAAIIQPRTSIPKEPQTALEKTLIQVWKDVLRVDTVGLDDNFFDLGGDSIRSVDVVTKAKEAGVQVRLKDLFRAQTIGALARVMESSRGESDTVSPPIRVTIDSLRAFGREALEQAGLDPAGAAIVTEVQLESSLRGQPTHNMADIPRYARRISKGTISPRPAIRIVRESAVSALIDGDNGPGQWVATEAMTTAIRKAKKSGIGIVAVKNSNHFGAAGHYVWMAAKEGVIGVCTTNGPLILAPTGGVQPTFGNNPLAVGLPAQNYRPIVLDIAMSAAPRGRIGLHLAEGRPLESGWILNKSGQPSQDLADLAAGLGVPIGGHKGYGLALALEALAGALTGAGFCRDHEGHRGDLGHLFIAIDPELFLPIEDFRTRMDRLIEQTKTGTLAPDVKEILVPGETELKSREQNLREGVPLRLSAYQHLCRHAEKAGLQTRLVPLN